MSETTAPAEGGSTRAQLVEGLAAQLYVQDQDGVWPWWHLVREEIRIRYRRKAEKQIDEYERRVGRRLANREHR